MKDVDKNVIDKAKRLVDIWNAIKSGNISPLDGSLAVANEELNAAVTRREASPESVPWVKLAELRNGAVFETREGTRAVKSEYYYSKAYTHPQCVLLGSGEYAHFKEGDDTPVREIGLCVEEKMVRELYNLVKSITADAGLSYSTSCYFRKEFQAIARKHGLEVEG